MSIEVPESVKKKAEKCAHNFACLEAGQFGDPDLCSVHYVDGKDVIFLSSCDDVASCAYRMPFGGRYVCRCPVRYEVLKRNSEI